MVKILPKEDLEKLSTKRLLSYKNKLMQVPEHPNEDGSGLNKDHPTWKRLYQDIKDILKTREHIEKKKQVEAAVATMENEGGLPSGEKK